MPGAGVVPRHDRPSPGCADPAGDRRRQGGRAQASGRMALLARIAVLAIAMAALPPAAAAARTPRQASEVLLTLPRTRALADHRIRSLADALAREPRDLAAASELSELYLGLAARSGDPRYYGYAKSVLTPWQQRSRLPAGMLRSRAEVRRYFHEFAQAKADTLALLALEPGDAGAWFDLALLQLGDGDARAAAAACDTLRRLAWVSGELCRGYIDSNGADLHRGYAELARALQALPETQYGQRRWALTALADAAARLRRPDDAERYYRAAQQLDPRAADVLTGYSDFLLDQARPRDALAVLAPAPDNVSALLRRCLAYRALHDARYRAATIDLAQRLRQRQRLGDSPYYAEEIRAQLYLFDQPARALTLAAEYWGVLKSPLSARLLVEAAAAAGELRAADDVRRWLHANPGVYPRLMAPMAVATRASAGRATSRAGDA